MKSKYLLTSKLFPDNWTIIIKSMRKIFIRVTVKCLLKFVHGWCSFAILAYSDDLTCATMSYMHSNIENISRRYVCNQSLCKELSNLKRIVTVLLSISAILFCDLCYSCMCSTDMNIKHPCLRSFLFKQDCCINSHSFMLCFTWNLKQWEEAVELFSD